MSGGTVIVPDQSLTSRMVALTQSSVDVTTSETTTSTSYTNLATTGPSITLSPGVTQNHLILFKTGTSHGTSASRVIMSMAVNGAAASDNDANYVTSASSGQDNGLHGHILATAQASGNTHTAKYKVIDTGTGTWRLRRNTGLAL